MAIRSHPLIVVIAFGVFASAASAEDPDKRSGKEVEEREVYDDPPATIPARANLLGRTPGMRSTTGPYVSVQVNVDEFGHNIVGDAANEPSIAVNPTNRNNLVIGWRQFDAVTSNFRQAGWAYTFDKGTTWTFPGVLTPGQFRSDPSLDVNSSGDFYYQSLHSDPQTNAIGNDVFKSTDGGVTWSDPVPAFGGDKNWLAVDRSGGPSDGYVYGIWQRWASCCGAYVLTRSIDGGATFISPVPVAFWPKNGAMTVGTDGTIFAVGIDATQQPGDFTRPVIAWPNFDGPLLAPPEDPGGRLIDMGGYVANAYPSPNPSGLSCQPNVAVDHSTGSTRGNVYVLGCIAPYGSLYDPLDVHFIRSTDSGRHFATFVRVNDDIDNNVQWFATHAVASNGRIDAIWFDSRFHRIFNIDALYYAYSWDAGATWSPNVRVSTVFDSWAGWPGGQQKIGDYMGIVSDATGADVAYPATFNGEQDVYYVRLFPDCNGNGISDVSDIAAHASQDCNASHIPDECETAPACIGAGSVPDGGSVPGAPLTIARGATDTIVLSWGASCATADADYAVYEGSLGDFASHAPRACSTAGSRSFELSPIAADAYYLIVPVNADREGSYGSASTGVERPQGTNACAPRVLRACGG